MIIDNAFILFHPYSIALQLPFGSDYRISVRPAAANASSSGMKEVRPPCGVPLAAFCKGHDTPWVVNSNISPITAGKSASKFSTQTNTSKWRTACPTQVLCRFILASSGAALAAFFARDVTPVFGVPGGAARARCKPCDTSHRMSNRVARPSISARYFISEPSISSFNTV